MRFDTIRFGNRTGKTLRRNPNGSGYVKHQSQLAYAEKQQEVFQSKSKANQSQDIEDFELDKRELIKKVETIAALHKKKMDDTKYIHTIDFQMTRVIEQLQ